MIALKNNLGTDFVERVRSIFGVDGLLSKAKNFEFRRQQHTARAFHVAEVIEDRIHALELAAITSAELEDVTLQVLADAAARVTAPLPGCASATAAPSTTTTATPATPPSPTSISTSRTRARRWEVKGCRTRTTPSRSWARTPGGAS